MIEHEVNKSLQTIASAASDIQRWCLQAALSGKVSFDRKADIGHAIERMKIERNKL